MKDEIKEILDKLNNESNYSNFITSQYGGPDYYYLLEKDEGKILSDYITNLQETKTNMELELQELYLIKDNLQEEIERLKEVIQKNDKEIDNLCKNQKKEIERLNNIIDELEKYIKDTKKYSNMIYMDMDFIKVEDILNKLKELKEGK